MSANTTIGISDPSIARQFERQSTTALTPTVTGPATVSSSGTATSTAPTSVRSIAPVVSGSEVIYPQAITSVASAQAANSVTITQSANNEAGDITTVYSTPGTISVTSVDQRVNQYSVYNTGVSQIIAGNNITISSTIANGKGEVTINANAGGANYNDSNVVSLLASFGSNTISTTGNVSVGNISATNLGNIVGTNYDGNSANVLHGDGSWSADITTYGNSNVVTLLGAFGSNTVVTTGNITSGNANLGNLITANYANLAFDLNANVVNANYLYGDGSNITNLPVGNIASINLDGNASNVLRGDGTFGADANSSYGDSNVATLLGSFGSNNISTTGNISVGTLNVAGNVTSNLLPNANVTYNLGSNTQRWNDIWLANSTIHLGEISLSVSNSGQLSTSEFIEGGEGIGGIAYIEWTTDSELSIRTDNVSPFIATFESLKINDSFTLLTGGNGLPANTVLSVSNTIAQTTPVPGFIDFIIPVDDVPASNVFVYTFNLTRSPVTEFSQLTGNTINLGNTSITSNGNSIVVNSLTVLSSNSITLGNATISSNGNALVVDSIQLTNGNIGAVGNIASINLDGSSSNVLYGNGIFAAAPGGGTPAGSNNQVQFNSNGAFGASGNYIFTDTVGGGTVTVGNELNLLGNGTIGTSNNNLNIQPAGNLVVTASAYNWTFGTDGLLTLPEGAIIDTLGNNFEVRAIENVNFEANAVVNIYTDGSGNAWQWQFGDDGNLILAGGNSVIQSIANSSLDPTNPNVSTMVLTPDANYNSQVLVLDPTAPGHIHLRAHAFSNIDDPAANIFLGGEDTAFEITQGANNQARIHSGGNTWTFDNNGDLSAPNYIKFAGNSFIGDETSGNIFRIAAPLGYGVILETDADISGNNYQFDFGSDGNLTAPGDVNVTGNISATNIGNISNINIDGSSSNVLYGNGVFAPQSSPLFVVANANITASVNTSYQIDNSVANANINFTLPDGNGLSTGSFVKINPYDLALGNFQYFVVTNGANSGGIQGLAAPLSANRPTTLVWGGSFWYYSN